MAEDINAAILETFGRRGQDIRTYSPHTLAFLGDGIFELIVRTLIVGEGNRPAKKLQLLSSGIVRARSQMLLYEAVSGELSEEEQNVFRRGKNANVGSKAKNASFFEYRNATGYEALLGYLYLQGKKEEHQQTQKSQNQVRS